MDDKSKIFGDGTHFAFGLFEKENWYRQEKLREMSWRGKILRIWYDKATLPKAQRT